MIDVLTNFAGHRMKRNIVFLFIFITWGFTCARGELFPDSDDFFMMSQLMRGACNHAAGTGHSPGPGPAQRLAATSGAGSGVGGSFNSLLTPLLIDKLMDLRAPPARPSPGKKCQHLRPWPCCAAPQK